MFAARTFRAGRSGQSVPEHIGVAGLLPQGQQNATSGLALRRLSAGQRMRAKSTTSTAPNDPPSSRRREALLLPSKPHRPSHLANFLIWCLLSSSSTYDPADGLGEGEERTSDRATIALPLGLGA